MIRTALAQIDPIVGDIEGNVRLALGCIERARSAGAQVIALPELTITGYPPEDLLLRRSFIAANRSGLDEVVKGTAGIMAIVGFVEEEAGALFNAAAICSNGELLSIYRKHLLPNYGVFDEQRHFKPGTQHTLVETQLGVVGVCVCEDAWSPTGPVIAQGDAGAQMVVNINASPFHKSKLEERITMLGERARRAGTSIVYVNCTGGQDELVFDGGSLVIGPDGSVVAQLPQFEQAFAVVDVPLGQAREVAGPGIERVKTTLPSAEGPIPAFEQGRVLSDAEEMYRALCMGIHDYVTKNGFTKIVVGLSGGVDSALVATIAADALGNENVLTVAMPSEFSSEHSLVDAKQLAQNMDVELIEIPIARPYHAYLDALEGPFGATEMGVAEENIQARIRGNLLMAISNRYGHLVVATGNKSEMAVGYATLYGDMAGGFALLKDVFKTEVYALCAYRNSVSSVIPENIIKKAPSAELRPGQKDSDSLPPYEVLDPILESYIEEDASAFEIVAAGADPAVVKKVIALVDRAEYKRRQAAPGPKVTTKAFGRDRRLPITNRWREDPEAR